MAMIHGLKEKNMNSKFLRYFWLIKNKKDIVGYWVKENKHELLRDMSHAFTHR